MIEVEGLRKTFGTKVAVNDISFEVPRGQVLGFLGPNGAGKSTTMRVLTSFLMPDSGKAKIGGFDVVEQSRESRSRIGYLAESAPLYGDMRVDEYLGFMADVRNIPRDKRKARIAEVIQDCGLKAVLMNTVHTLSRGYRQRVGLALAILHDPDVLILDEPTSGLDPNQIVEIRSLIKKLGEKKTVILSTHIMQEVTAVCSRVLIISDGKLRADGTPDELTRRASGTEIVHARIKAEANELEPALRQLRGVHAVRVAPGSNGYVNCDIDVDQDRDVGEAVFCLVRDKGWMLSELKRERISLEDVFAKVTTGNSQE